MSNAPPTSEWSIILLPPNVPLILKVWGQLIFHSHINTARNIIFYWTISNQNQTVLTACSTIRYTRIVTAFFHPFTTRSSVFRWETENENHCSFILQNHSLSTIRQRTKDWQFLERKSLIWSLKFQWSLILGPIHNKLALAEVMVYCQTGDKPFPEPMMTQFTNTYMHHSMSWIVPHPKSTHC